MNLAKPYKILVVDDEEDICEILKFNLESEGYLVDIAIAGTEALLMPLNTYHLFLLDIMMPGMSGFKLADELRKKLKLDTPVIFLTAKDTENDKLTGFSLGADDYITKPFSVKEIIARISAILRRAYSDDQTKEINIKFRGLELDLQTKQILVEGIRTNLTPHEFEIIHLLLKNPGKVYTREDILQYSWKEAPNVVDRTIDVHVNRLRKKLGNYGNHLITRSGYGYCFNTA
jgi:two-component system, OmpR family, alkaline phosphatase synthesis response regulator PhoP